MTTTVLAGAHGAHGIGLLSLTAMWIGMMAVMMAPTAWPWLLTFQRLSGPSRGLARAASLSLFASGYLTAWAIYGVAAAGLQVALSRAGWLHANGALGATAAASILIGAGLFQFTSLKRACLTHCRNPLSFLLARWHNGPIGGYRLGLAHGWFCVGCCWALMTTVLAIGMSSWLWMIALTAAVAVEQVVPGGDRIRWPLGATLVATGVWQFVG